MTNRADLERLADEIRRSHYGDAWHGSAVSELLADVAPETAAARPIGGAHTIWEIALHIRTWRREVARRLVRRKSGEPEDGDWPAAPGSATTKAPVSVDAWERDRASLAAATDELIAAVRNLSSDELDRPLESTRDPALGTGTTLRAMIHGIPQHDAYHGGQIALLKRAEAGPASRKAKP